MKLSLILSTGILISSCAIEPTVETGIEASIKNTPITLVIQIDDVSISTAPKAHESRSIVSARVLSTLRGTVADKIQYTMTSEIGDEAVAGLEPILISLCHINGRLYSAGVGTEFAASRKTLKYAKKISRSTSSTQTEFDYCE